MIDRETISIGPVPESVHNSLVQSAQGLISSLTIVQRRQLLLASNSVATTTGRFFDQYHCRVLADAAFSGGFLGVEDLTVFDNFANCHPHRLNNPVTDIANYVQDTKKTGRRVGLKFGHYRRLTASQMVELIFAREHCDSLVLCIESGARTQEFKHKRVELKDSERMEMIARSGLVDALAMTTGRDYSNDYYRELVSELGPDILFAAETWETDVIEEYELRAGLVGAELVLLPNLAEYTTTEMERLIFPEEQLLLSSRVEM